MDNIKVYKWDVPKKITKNITKIHFYYHPDCNIFHNNITLLEMPFYINDKKFIFPKKLKELIIFDSDITSFTTILNNFFFKILPKSLEKLEIDCVEVKECNQFPSNLRSLTVQFEIDFNILPKKLEYLSIYHYNSFNYHLLPNKIHTLKIFITDDIENFYVPEFIKKLTLNYVGTNYDFPFIPNNIIELELSGFKNNIWFHFPLIKKLTLIDCSIKLDFLPQTLEELTLVSHQEKIDGFLFPRSLKKINYSFMDFSNITIPNNIQLTQIE